ILYIFLSCVKHVTQNSFYAICVDFITTLTIQIISKIFETPRQLIRQKYTDSLRMSDTSRNLTLWKQARTSIQAPMHKPKVILISHIKHAILLLASIFIVVHINKSIHSLYISSIQSWTHRFSNPP
ncbi:hypothetical protein ACJX0J_040846, partial [Zea mays]